ncbi:type II toxin-antitoxin system prevent-host-death family antitoxin [Actinomyces oris]|uniref:type II toxin-antitoxin system Phd/YefM family antitoxin n=1 Tax=Actinomyces oris TaxID=544580 RepID=UPI0028EC16A0|nr:type II toxin-antitoxin system prevent-host-death family antitoxin [Actinomyces oris]
MYMQTIMHRELRNNSAAILHRVQAGETFEITSNGEPVATLSPISRDRRPILRQQGAVREATHVDFRALKRTADVSSQAVLDDLRGE